MEGIFKEPIPHIRWYGSLSNYDNAVSFLGIVKQGERRSVLQPVQMNMLVTEAGYASDPSFVLPIESAQSLIDLLYRLGLRPTEAKSAEPQIEAIRYHLEDMRKIVFEKMATDYRNTTHGTEEL